MQNGNWFFALLPAREDAVSLARWAREHVDADVWRLYAAEDLHVTASFVGPLRAEVDAQRLAQAAANAVADLRPCRWELRGLEGFPSAHEAKRVLYVPLVAPGADLEEGNRAWWTELTRRLQAAAQSVGYAVPDTQVPHLTVARARGKSLPVPQLEAWSGQLWARQLHWMGPGKTQRYQSFAQVSWQ